MADRLLYRAEALRAYEAAALATRPTPPLMERAGAAVARVATAMADDRAGPVVVLAGPGNNGGDALVAARLLRDGGIDVVVAMLADPAGYRGDAADAWRRLGDVGGRVVDDPRPWLDAATLIVDGLFGIGFRDAPDERAAAWIAAVNDAHRPVLAIDVPSGVDAGTGRVAGVAIVADRTLTFLVDKPGLHTGDAVDHVGSVVVDALGMDRISVDRGGAPAAVGSTNDPALFAALRRPRRPNSHKGTHGSLVVVGGDHGMVGAALMASRMALYAGTGRIYVKLVGDDAPSHDPLHPELMLRETLDGVDATAVAIGPGLGHRAPSLDLLATMLSAARSLCVDADGLNAIAKRDDLAARLCARETPAVLTPHPLEAARLLDRDVKDVQRDRVASAAALAAATRSVVVLKGAGTVIAEPDGTWVVNRTGNAALGTGGTGDVLCGLVGSLLAQDLRPADAARAAVWLHGRAADDLVATGVGPVGLTASELIPAIRTAINRVRGQVVR